MGDVPPNEASTSSSVRPEDEPLYKHRRYVKIRDINKGAFGIVQLALDRWTGEQVAIKFLSRGEKVSKYVHREILNHRRLKHPHVINMHGIFLTPCHLGIVMEFAAGGDLYGHVLRHRGLSEADARWFFQQLIIAVDFCHRMGVANRDIKLENTLLDGSFRPLIKLCDFGYSKHEKFQSAPGSRVGTPAYLAPEVILTTRGTTYDAKAADVWGCGVMLYTMLSAQYPFRRAEDEALRPAERMHAMLQRTLNVEYVQLPAHVSPECRDLVSRILVADPGRRIRVPEIMAHPWYARGLPEGVAAMNDQLLPPAGREGGDTAAEPNYPGQQTRAEIDRIVEEARHTAAQAADLAAAAAAGGGGFDDDDADLGTAMGSLDADRYDAVLDGSGSQDY